MIYIVTCGRESRFAEVLALAESAAEALPGQRFVWLVSGSWSPCYASLLGSIPGAVAEYWRPQVPVYGRTARAQAAAIPQAMLEIATRPDCTWVLYCSPNVLWTSRPSEILDKAEGDVILVPRLLRPQTAEGVPDRELRALTQGIFGHGFLAAKAGVEGRRFLAWWRDRLLETRLGDCTPGSWLHLAPAFFASVQVLRHPRFNIGSGNLHERRLEGSFPRVTIGGEPVAFFDLPLRADRQWADDELDPQTEQAFRSVVSWYEHRLRTLAGHIHVEDLALPSRI
jgi:hypothetical protein